MNDLQAKARLAISLLDLTSLNDDDTEKTIQNLCANSVSVGGNVAAVCVYPSFIQCAKNALESTGASGIKVATVANFPEGAVDLLGAFEASVAAVAAGADEVDVVFPWRALMAGDYSVGEELVQACRRACEGKAKLKVIIESGHLAAPALIRQASEVCVGAGADYIKTSTGKLTINATPTAVQVIAEVLRDSGTKCGIKISGGVRTPEEANNYIDLVEKVMGEGWVTPETFRFGASGLLNSLLKELKNGNRQNKD